MAAELEEVLRLDAGVPRAVGRGAGTRGAEKPCRGRRQALGSGEGNERCERGPSRSREGLATRGGADSACPAVGCRGENERKSRLSTSAAAAHRHQAPSTSMSLLAKGSVEHGHAVAERSGASVTVLAARPPPTGSETPAHDQGPGPDFLSGPGDHLHVQGSFSSHHPRAHASDIPTSRAAARAAGGGRGGGGRTSVLRGSSRNQTSPLACMVALALLEGRGSTCRAFAGRPLARPARVLAPGPPLQLHKPLHKPRVVSSRRGPIAAGSPAAAGTLASTAAAAAVADPAMLLLALAGVVAAWAAWTLLRFVR